MEGSSRCALGRSYALDIATLSTGLDERNPRKHHVGVALAAVAGVTLLDIACAQALMPDRHKRPVRDYGDRLEALSGVEEGQLLAVNPSDVVREGIQGKPVLEEKAPAKK